MMAQAWGWN